MLRETDVFDAQGFAFAEFGEPKVPALVSVEHGAQGAAATIADAHLLFNSDFTRSGNDLHLDGHNGERAIVRDYFAAEPAALLSREGARLSPDLVEALTRSASPHQYAQATPPAPAATDAVGRVVTASPDSTILRNGVPVTVAAGDPVLRGDVLQTAGGTMAVTFNDGSTLNLTANTRIVVSEFIYSPSNTGNSQLLDLVQGSLTFISGEVAHTGNMSIGTPVATMGIRGTVGGVTTASDGTVQFYVSQSATGAVIINQQGQIIANVVQDGPMIVVRPVGPLQIIADEIQKTPAQLAVELQALQQIVNIKAVGDQLLQQFFQQQQQPNPNPQSPPNGPHTQIPGDDPVKITLFLDDTKGGNGGATPATHAVIEKVVSDDAPPVHVHVPVPVNLPPVTFAPLSAATAEDTPLVFSGPRAISIVDNDSSSLTVTLSVTNGVLALGTVAGLTFISGGTGQATMTFSGSPAAIAAALQGLTYTPGQDYNGTAALSITKTDGASAPTTTTVALQVTPVNDAPVIGGPAGTPVAYTECDGATIINASLTISDVDSATLSGATVKIAGNFVSGEDVLSFTTQGGITGVYNAATGVLTLSGTASLADYQAVLRSVTYENTSESPSGLPRSIEFQVNDGAAEHAASNVVAVTVNVTPVNDAPVLAISPTIDLPLIAGAGPGGNLEPDAALNAQIAGNDTVQDALTGLLTGPADVAAALATVRAELHVDTATAMVVVWDYLDDIYVSAGPNQGNVNEAFTRLGIEYAKYLKDGGAPLTNITAKYTPDVNNNGTPDREQSLHDNLLGNLGAAALQQRYGISNPALQAELTALIEAIDPALLNRPYYSGNDTASPAAVQAWDLANGYAPGTPPGYTENGSPVFVASGLTLSDVDSATLSGATVKIAGNFVSGEDVLSFTTQGGITGTYDAATGVLTLSGTASLADYQAVLRSVTYENTSESPSGLPRSIEFQV
ncbi:MAG TPA: FecR domain-containing protein, partial [Pseudolabrys sp.]|nr:FecR domain-containing protein [Pseudolabrys sp.]